MPDLARVHIVGRLWRRPACRALTGVMGLTSRQNIAGVVEMRDLFQAREVSVMPVGLHEGWRRPLVHIAQRRHLHSRLVVWRELEPSLVHGGGLAQQMSLLEKSADAAIDE